MRQHIAVVHPYWNFWESSVDGDLKGDRARLLDRAVRHLSAGFEVTASILVCDVDEAAAAHAQCADADAIVVISSMAVPPTTGMALLSELPMVPVVIWALSEFDALPQGFSHSDITTSGATVGAPMLGSALARQGRPFDLVVSTLESPDRIDLAVRRAAAAGQVRQARILSIGGRLPGYVTVDAPDGGLVDLGPTVISVAPEDLVTRAQNVPATQVYQLASQVEGQFSVAQDVDRLGLERAIRTESALRSLVAETRTTAGAMNCHVASLRPNPEFAIAPCLALGRLTTEGIPWTCTGDVLTSIAMLAVQGLGHPTLYHEIEALDHDADEAILANTGEHDLRLCGSAPPKLVPNVWYQSDPVNAPCAQFSIPAGPATLVGFAYAPEPRFVVAEGEFTGRQSPSTGTPNAGFRFASGPVGEAWARWGQAGVLHHSAATNAHVASDIEVVARHLGASFVSV